MASSEAPGSRDDGGTAAAARRDDADTVELISEARAGHRSALDLLFARQYETLRRWTRGRLPSWARGTSDTADIVQDALMRVLGKVDSIEVRGKGALAAYLRRSIQNRILDEMRYVGLRPPADLETLQIIDPAPSVIDTIATAQDQQRYKAALARLSAQNRELIVGAIELGYSHEQLALATGRPNANAARVALHRAVRQLVDEMGRG